MRILFYTFSFVCLSNSVDLLLHLHFIELGASLRPCSPNAGWLLGRCPRLHVPCVGLCLRGKGGLGGMWGCAHGSLSGTRSSVLLGHNQ